MAKISAIKKKSGVTGIIATNDGKQFISFNINALSHCPWSFSDLDS